MATANDNDARLPLRMPGKVHRTLRYLARAQGVSMNDIVLRSVEREISRLKKDDRVMSLVRAIIEQEQNDLGDLTGDTPEEKPAPKKRAKRRATA